MLRIAFFVTLMVVVVFAKKRNNCPCRDDDFDYTLPISDNDIIRNLRITQLGLPGRYNQRFVDNIQSLIGAFIISGNRMREQGIDQKYIDQMENYQKGFEDRINRFGSLSSRVVFVNTVTDFSRYLTSQIQNVNRYIQTLRDSDVQYYFYNMALDWASARSFYDYALDTAQCIYQPPVIVNTGGGNNGGNHKEGKGSEESDDRTDLESDV